MKIVLDYNIDKPTDIIKIVTAKYIGDYAIRISFNDGLEKLIDFKPFLNKSVHPSISKYLDEGLFEQFKINNGNLNWNDYDLIFPVHNLYEGSVG